MITYVDAFRISLKGIWYIWWNGNWMTWLFRTIQLFCLKWLISHSFVVSADYLTTMVSVIVIRFCANNGMSFHLTSLFTKWEAPNWVAKFENKNAWYSGIWRHARSSRRRLAKCTVRLHSWMEAIWRLKSRCCELCCFLHAYRLLFGEYTRDHAFPFPIPYGNSFSNTLFSWMLI